MYFLLRWAINTIALGVAVLIVKGVHVSGIVSLSVASLVIGLLNASLKPVMILFTLPLNILTLGFFTLVINTIMMLITSQLVRGFDVDGFWAAFVASMFMSIVSFLLNLFVKEGSDE
ncbi:phage holin family protein [Hippea alviniae]|uniref:phage holin family protein n=1 Tax=Hippea alviniae TaxID=1279027 RepID=UPI0003B5FFDF|nr:phage holin family protein [Hippea alviniae]